MADLHERYRLTEVINLSGPLTTYGTSISSEAVATAAGASLRHHFNMDELFQRSGQLIAEWSGAEAGFLTSSSASGVTLAVAACMTGADRGRISQLPDATGMKDEVIIQKGHTVNFGAPIEQMMRLAGASVREVGTVNRTNETDITHAFSERTAAAMFVVSHHTTLFGYVQLDRFVEICHARGVPVIVDGAAQDHQIGRLVASGADLIIVSAQKYLAGPTGGVICGRRDLIKAMYLQNWGIGRTMKIGKEGILGTMAALEDRLAIDLDEWAANQREKAVFLAGQLEDIPGLAVTLELDKVGQPVTRVRIEVDPDSAGLDARQLCDRLAASTPSIKPRAHHTDEGWFYLEPVPVNAEEMLTAATRVREIVAMAQQGDQADQAPETGDAFLRWLE